MNLLLVDDDVKLLRTLKEGLVEQGHSCETFAEGQPALERLLVDGILLPDIVLLDVMMPKMSGWSLLERMRSAGLRTPVIFLTARQEVDERVRGLELGADDYIIKPFAFKELMARVEAVLRRHSYTEPLRHGALVVHRMQKHVEHAGRRIEVSENEHAFLEVLSGDPGRIFSREELLKAVWRIQFDPGTNLVDVLVARLRRKLGRKGASVIETVVRKGYRLGPCEDPGAQDRSPR